MTEAISCSPEAMMADLDATADPRDASTWLGRRHLLWGASEMPILFVARGLLGAGNLTQAQRDEMESAKRGPGQGVPKYLARKAGLMRDKKGQSQEHTVRVELELLAAWKRNYAEDYGIDPTSIRHASEWPIEWQPMPDRMCPALGASWDAYGRDFINGEIVGIELKAPPEAEAWARWGGRWSVQVHAQNGVLGYARTLLVCGNCWAIPDHPGPITTHEIERNEREIALCREAATDAMATVEELLRERS